MRVLARKQLAALAIAAVSLAACADVVGADFGDYELENNSTSSSNGSGGASSSSTVSTGGAQPLPNILIVGTDINPSSIELLKTGLANNGEFSGVTFYDAFSTTPSLAQLKTYSAVLVYFYNNVQDPVALGNVLADYYDDGGRVVVVLGALCDGFRLSGRFDTEGYMTMNSGPLANMAAMMTTLTDPSHPVVQNVASFTTFPHCDLTLANGATPLASFTTGEPAIAVKQVGDRNRVDVAIFPDDVATANGDVVRLISNALQYE